MPAAVTLMRPTSVSGLILSGGTGSGVSTAGTEYFIKVVTARMRHRVPLAEVTGDGDSHPSFLPSYYLYVDWLIRGWAVAGQAIGILNMSTVAQNPTDDSTLVVFNLAGSTRTLTGRFVIGGIDIEWSRTAAYVGVSMLLKNTVNTDDGQTSYTEN